MHLLKNLVIAFLFAFIALFFNTSSTFANIPVNENLTPYPERVHYYADPTSLEVVSITSSGGGIAISSLKDNTDNITESSLFPLLIYPSGPLGGTFIEPGEDRTLPKTMLFPKILIGKKADQDALKIFRLFFSKNKAKYRELLLNYYTSLADRINQTLTAEAAATEIKEPIKPDTAIKSDLKKDNSITITAAATIDLGTFTPLSFKEDVTRSLLVLAFGIIAVIIICRLMIWDLTKILTQQQPHKDT